MIVVDEAGALLADSEGLPAGEEVSYASRPEVGRALAGRPSQGTRHSDSLDEDLLFTSVPVFVEGRRAGAVRVTQGVDAVRTEVRNDVIALIGVGLVALLLDWPSPGFSPARSPSPCALWPGQRGGSPRAISTPAPPWRGPPSSARWPGPSTR